ncbi:DUF1553 domain-containing protein [Portibacter marinus]|uniref:DUF1553 domain-containing protein n=1 Tax=Portibacter marinus TaxID=2898660 RepID=UPI001F401B01|nr:DUF1553 domain-containing protein [Portibacter marinus]
MNNKEQDYDLGAVKDMVSALSDVDTLSTSQKEDLNLEVRAIIAHNCYQCHSEFKKKGGLALDSKRGLFQGGENGVVIVPGSAEESEMSRRINLPSNHDEVMPKKGKTLQKSEIDLIDLWINQGAYWSDKTTGSFKEAPLALSKPIIDQTSIYLHPVDIIVNEYFLENRIEWPVKLEDKDFVRRAHLDITGLLPDTELVNWFIKNEDPDKREELINYLLTDVTNYTEHWLTFWNDLLRNDYSGPGFITGGRKQITDWLYASLLSNKSYNEMTKELVNPNKASEGFIKGIQWRGVVNASQRTEMQAAQNIGQSLMGVNVKCASCHNSFVSNITLKQAYEFASIFAESPLELNRCDKPTGVMSKVSFLYNELGSVQAETIDERLELLEDVMVQPDNGRLYRTLVNRIWKNLMGRGLVEPVDEMDNTPWNHELLDWLASDFIESGTDIKHLLKTIMTSRIYQSKAVSVDNISDLNDDQFVFSGPIMRRLTAEQFSDAISKVIAPMFHSVGYHPCEEMLSNDRYWHKELKFDRVVLPEPGERYFRWKLNIKDDLQKAELMLSVDHSFEFFVNGQKLAEGEDWREVKKLDLKDFLKQGQNLIAIKASNEGKLANPAGILYALKMMDEDGNEEIIQGGEGWKSFDSLPNPSWKDIEYDDRQWVNLENYRSMHWDKLLDFTSNENDQTFARASLVKQHPFLKALGRPTRENVTTSRDQQATLLQALELTNGAFLSQVLEEGAKEWLVRYEEHPELMVEQLYQELLSRKPTVKEKRIVSRMLGPFPNNTSVQDLFWALILLPEFQFIS